MVYSASSTTSEDLSSTTGICHWLLEMTIGAPALVFGIPEIPARAGVHGRHQHETAGECGAAVKPADGDPSLLQGLPQVLQNAAPELGEFIQEQNAAVGQADLARTRQEPASD